MPELNEVVHDGPVAGQSLTAEFGARPWQSPPQYNTLEEALEHKHNVETMQTNLESMALDINPYIEQKNNLFFLFLKNKKKLKPKSHSHHM